jgi:cardiolipin hydrolase
MMTAKEFDEILKQTMADLRLSGSEKRALTDVLQEHAGDEQRLAFFRHRAFEIAQAAIADQKSKSILDWLEDVIKVLTPSASATQRTVADACFSPGDDCPGRICSLLDRSRKSVDICVFTITDNRIASSIERAHWRGVQVRIITDNEKQFDRGSDIPHLQEQGVAIRIDKSEYHMHHKFAVFDKSVVLTGSYNWTRGAAENNEENFVVTDEPRLVSAFTRAFEKLWTKLAF